MKPTKKELRKLPTLRDVTIAGQLAKIAFAHFEAAKKERPEEFLSDKFARFLKEARVKK